MNALLKATGKNTTSKAIDRATKFYIKMAGDNVAVPTGTFVELVAQAERQGSVAAEEIAEALNTDCRGSEYRRASG
ncbi:hypothetical protein [Halorussus salinisoli]|uniref:hypothetical protein n=1 Tax=Halorussus salinisoli TaxID=2558242 RepID=UPI0010C19400|nr:hypothetical protein [Halorussus salinisoli]